MNHRTQNQSHGILDPFWFKKTCKNIESNLSLTPQDRIRAGSHKDGEATEAKMASIWRALPLFQHITSSAEPGHTKEELTR